MWLLVLFNEPISIKDKTRSSQVDVDWGKAGAKQASSMAVDVILFQIEDVGERIDTSSRLLGYLDNKNA